MKKITWALIIFAPIWLYGQKDLDFFIKSAVKNNPQIKELNQTLAFSKLDRELINAENSLPKLSLTANYTFVPYFNNGGKLISSNPQPDAIGYDVAITDGGLYSALFNAEKNIFNGSVIDALNRQVTIKDESSKNNVNLISHDIEKQVTDQYFKSFLSLKMIRLEEEVLSLLGEEEKVLKALTEKGLLKESDYLLLQVEIQNQTNGLNSAKSQYTSDMNQLYNTCGITGFDGEKIDSVFIPLVSPKNITAYKHKFALDSLTLINQQEILETKYNPQISVFFNTGLMAVELEGIQRKFGLSAGINFSLPIYDGGQKSITRQQSEVSVKNISFYRDYFFTQLNSQKAASLLRIKSLETNLSNLQSQTETYKRVIEISKKEFEKGLLSSVDYLTILKNFIDLKKNLLTTQTDYQLEICNYNYWNW
jgi:outer membrane protein TolC